MSIPPYQQRQQEYHTGQPFSLQHTGPVQSVSSNDPADLLLAHFPEAAKLTRDDLEEMLRSPEYFDAFFGTLPQTTALYKEHQDLLHANLQVTAANMALKEKHEHLKKETQLAFDEARSLQAKWHNEITPMQEASYKRFAPATQLPRLRQGLGDQERLSESLISQLLDESINPDEFIKSFKQVRKHAYRRSVMVEKWIGGQVKWEDS